MKNKDKKYVGGWSANRGGTFAHDYTSNNLRELKARLIDACRENIFAGNSGTWSIDYNDQEKRESTPLLEGVLKN